MKIYEITEAAGDNCEKCRGRGKLDLHSEDPHKCNACDGTGKQKWKPEPVDFSKFKKVGEQVEETIDNDDDFFEAYGWIDGESLEEAEYQGRKVKLGKPMQGDVKKFKVYVKDPKTGNVKKVNFGHGGSSVKGKAMKIKKSNPARRKSFRARHNCDNPGPRTKARYWSCRKW